MPLNLTAKPNPGAVAKLGARTPVASVLRSADWARLPLALRERSQFSAGVDEIRVVATIQDKVLKRVAMQREQVAHGPAIAGGTAGVSRESFVADLKQVIREQGLPMGGESLTDISSAARLRLIYDFQTQSAANFARWKMGQDSNSLDNFPAQEFIRVESRENPRNWAPRWDMAFAPFEGATRATSGRMVALMNHPGWSNLSRFGTPWPPFDYGSGMGVEVVDRDDAIALGLLGADDRIESSEVDFNDGLEASVEGVPPAFRSKLTEIFGDQVQFKKDKAVWQGNLIGDLVDRVEEYGLDRPFDNQLFKGQSVSFGQATPRTVEVAGASGFDLAGGRMVLTPDVVNHLLRQHGPEGEKRSDQRPMTKLDFELLPWTWREPDASETEKGTLVLKKNILGRQMMVAWEQRRGQNVYQPISVRVKR